jgi:hypothetical protein
VLICAQMKDLGLEDGGGPLEISSRTMSLENSGLSNIRTDVQFLPFHYRDQPVMAVKGNSRCLLYESHKSTYIHTVGKV